MALGDEDPLRFLAFGDDLAGDVDADARDASEHPYALDPQRHSEAPFPPFDRDAAE